MATERKRAEARARALKNLADMTGKEDAAITADALADPDNPPADDLINRKGTLDGVRRSGE